MTIYTFDNFWTKYHYLTNRYKTNKEQARNLWERTINKSVKRKAFDNIHKGIKTDAYTFLQKQFKLS